MAEACLQTYSHNMLTTPAARVPAGFTSHGRPATPFPHAINWRSR
ncbi:hypothetical protein [Mycolicibacterium mengxianglii]|nr:hypothetical protein [Mycolicibacterium mengxianglii]